MTTAIASCTLYAVRGENEPCPRERCAFWDTRNGACAFAGVEHELAHPEGLAAHLLELRRALEDTV